jgi:hypothetical protein
MLLIFTTQERCTSSSHCIALCLIKVRWARSFVVGLQPPAVFAVALVHHHCMLQRCDVPVCLASLIFNCSPVDQLVCCSRFVNHGLFVLIAR